VIAGHLVIAQRHLKLVNCLSELGAIKVTVAGELEEKGPVMASVCPGVDVTWQ
jgi:hypothetical protein